MSDDQTVLVTGASGFIATHVVQLLQKRGYRVRGTVRSTSNEEKVKPLKELCPDAKHPIELFEADLTKDEGWKEAVSGCDFVIHTASPLPDENPQNDDEVIKPAVEGTLSVLRACREAKCVKRVVLTSSLAAIAPGAEDGMFSEENWTDLDKPNTAYTKSKTLAEKAAWDFVGQLPDEDKFELAVINPGYVLGLVLCGGFATIMVIPKKLLQREMPALPRMNIASVDVRDVATAHVNAMTVPEAAGNRHIVVAENLWFKEIAVIYDEEFKKFGYKLPMKEAPIFLTKVVAMFDKTVKMIIPILGKVATYDNTRMRDVLNIEPRGLKEALLEMAHSMIEKGIVKKTEKYKQAKDRSE